MKKIYYLLAIFLLYSGISHASAKISSTIAGKLAMLVINNRVVLQLSAGFQGLTAGRRIKLVEERLRNLTATQGFEPGQLGIKSAGGLTGITYRGDWLVIVDEVSARSHQLTPYKLAELWVNNIKAALGEDLKDEPVTEVIVGHASWYGREFRGRKTAAGEIFDENKFTAAHRRLPFGTRVRVTNLTNQRQIVVVINDRGPWIKSREIDLSAAAARVLGISGVSKVKIEVLGDM